MKTIIFPKGQECKPKGGTLIIPLELPFEGFKFDSIHHDTMFDSATFIRDNGGGKLKTRTTIMLPYPLHVPLKVKKRCVVCNVSWGNGIERDYPEACSDCNGTGHTETDYQVMFQSVEVERGSRNFLSLAEIDIPLALKQNPLLIQYNYHAIYRYTTEVI